MRNKSLRSTALIIIFFILIDIVLLGVIGTLMPEDSPFSFRMPASSKYLPQGSFLSGALSFDAQDIPSPHDRVQEKDISVFEDKVIVRISSPKLISYTYKRSMEPAIKLNSIVIGITPQDKDSLFTGDIISYSEGDDILLSRISDTGHDRNGWYALLKDDSSYSIRAKNVRFEDIHQVVVAIVYDRIEDIYILEDSLVMFIDRPQWARFTDTNSMDPVLDSNTHAIEQMIESPDQISTGDIVSYVHPLIQDTVIHRVTETGFDEDGWYAIEKGDNISDQDPGKVRAGQLQRVVTALIY